MNRSGSVGVGVGLATWALVLVCGTPAGAATAVPGLLETQRLSMPFYGSVVVPGPGAGRAPGGVLRVSQTCRVLPLALSPSRRLRRRPAAPVAGCSGSSALGGRPVVSDLDRDGVMDVVIPDAAGDPGAGAGRTFVAFGRPEGRFDAPLRLSSRYPPNVAAIGDVDGDGREDIIVASDGRRTGGPDAAGPEVTVFLQSAARDFRARVAFSPTSSAYRMLPVDADHDGRLDLILADASGVELRRGRGEGAFSAGERLVRGENAALRLVDFDADGRLDLISLDYDGGVTLLRGGQAGFGRPEVLRRGRYSPEFRAVMGVSDLDGDAVPEVILVYGDDLRVFRLDERGRLKQALVLDTANDPRNLEVLDTDQDGDAEALVVANEFSLRLVVVNRPGPPSRPVLLSSAVPTVDADRSAHLIVGCTHGVGPCHGRATIFGHGGRRLGTEPFELPRGARTDLRVPLRGRPVRTRARVRLRTMFGARQDPVALRPATRRERRRACGSGRTIAQRGGGRLFYPPGAFEAFGCLDAVGGWYELPADVLRGPLAVFGRYSVFHHELCDDTCLPRLGVADIQRRRGLGGVDPFACSSRCLDESEIGGVAVGAGGALVWLTCSFDGARNHCRRSWTMYALDRRGRRRVARGADLRAPRLRVSRSGHRVVLSAEGVRRTVRLRGAPRLAPDPF